MNADLTKPAAKKSIAKKPMAKKIVVKKPVVPAASAAAPKKSKPKLVRDSFTIPKDEYQVLTDLKARLTKLMQPAKKSELLRAGLKALAAMPDAVIKKALQMCLPSKQGVLPKPLKNN